LCRRLGPAKCEPVNLLAKLKRYLGSKQQPEHLRRGSLGEQAAKEHLQRLGLKFLAANFRSERGEIDLIFRERELSDADCIVFAEVKTRTQGQWLRPAAAVDKKKRQLLSATALRYLREAGCPSVRIRFDIVEVLLRDGVVQEIRHIANAFPLQGNAIYPV